MWKVLPLLALALTLTTDVAHAQFFFKKAAPKVPAQRVPELLTTLRGDPDERRRANAAEELREYDIKAFPEIVPTLAESAVRDTKSSVRSDALSSLSRIRPVTNVAGKALEHAAANDSHWPNRVQAKSALIRYQWSGYSSQAPEVAKKEGKAPLPSPVSSSSSPLPKITTIAPPAPVFPPVGTLTTQERPMPQSYPMPAPIPQPYRPLPTAATQPYRPLPTAATQPPMLTPPVLMQPPVIAPQPYSAEPPLQFKPATPQTTEIPLIDLNPVLNPTPQSPAPPPLPLPTGIVEPQRAPLTPQINELPIPKF